LLILAGCSNPWEEYKPDFNRLLTGSWLYDEDEPRPAPVVYCYQTIGAADCHAVPLVGEGGRLQGYEGPQPRSRTVADGSSDLQQF
jgi:hypothetical protein